MSVCFLFGPYISFDFAIKTIVIASILMYLLSRIKQDNSDSVFETFMKGLRSNWYTLGGILLVGFLLTKTQTGIDVL
jgi:hypothetical protein